MLKNVFISFSYEDKKFVDMLTKFLVTKGFAVMQVAEEISPGDNIIAAIHHMIDVAEAILIVIPKSGEIPKSFQTEIDLISANILQGTSKKIIPILRDKFSDLPPVIDQYAILPAFSADYYQYSFNELLTSLDKQHHSESKERNIHIENEIIEAQHHMLLKELEEYEKVKQHSNAKVYSTLLSGIAGAITAIVTAATIGTIFSSSVSTWTTNNEGILGMSISVVIALFGGIAIGVLGTLFLQYGNKK